MKYLLVLGCVLVIFWVWRSARDRHGASQQPTRKPAAEPVKTEIVECDFCHVHLPRSEALTGPGGVYCCVAHRSQANKG